MQSTKDFCMKKLIPLMCLIWSTSYAEGLKAEAKINPSSGSQVTGTVTFEEVDGGVKVVADIKGLTPGKHGFHVHEHGDCSAPDASKAGMHYNPRNTNHGGPDSPVRHVGDLGNVVADDKGHAHYERIDAVITLDGPETIVGRSILVHADPDDYVSQPAGNSGKRIGCGLIELKK